MNIKITRYFDTDYYGSSASSEPILSSSVAGIFDCVLDEVLKIAEGFEKAEVDDVAIQKFERCFAEARFSLERGVEKDLKSVKLASFEKECGIRIACFIRLRTPKSEVSPNQNLVMRYLGSQMNAWFKNPVWDPHIAGVIRSILNFNQELNDDIARAIMGK